jgi:hypothetical protein
MPRSDSRETPVRILEIIADRALREAIFRAKPSAKAACLGGSHLYGLANKRSDVDAWVFHALPSRAFLGLRQPAVARSERFDLGGHAQDLRFVDIKAIVAAMAEGSFYELEHLFSPYVLFGLPWLETLRAQAKALATRKAYFSVLKRASIELRFSHGTPREGVKARLHAMRVLAAGSHYLLTGEVVSDIEALAGRQRFVCPFLPEALALIRDDRQPDDPGEVAEWLRPLSDEIERLTALLDGAFSDSSLGDGDDLEPKLDFFLRRLRLEMDDHRSDTPFH